jgi:hypothetical protein
MAPGVGPLAYEIVWLAHLNYSAQSLGDTMTDFSAKQAAGTGAASAAPAVALPDWRHITVGFVAGMVVMLLVQMQWREIRRRRQGMPAPSRG